MHMSKHFCSLSPLLAALLIAHVGRAQSTLTIGELAPAFAPAIFVSTPPADPTFAGQALVVEFWATWCGPCIAAVPHMNELQAAVGKDKIAFVSITDEAPDRVLRMMNRIKFESLVATDTSGKTQIDFGDGVSGLQAFPMTVVLDKDRKVLWVGEPKKLNEKLLRSLLDGSVKGTNQWPSKATQSAATKAELPALVSNEIFFNVFKDIRIQDMFVLTHTTLQGEAGGMLQMDNAGIATGASLVDMFQNLFNRHVSVNSVEADFLYDFMFITRDTTAAAGPMLEARVLQSLGMEMLTSVKTQEHYKLSVKNPKLLPVIPETPMLQMSDTEDGVVLSGVGLKTVAEYVSKKTGWWIDLDEAANANINQHDFILTTSDIGAFRKDLERYGLSLKSAPEQREVYTLQAIGK